CWGVSDLIYTELKSKGVTARVMQYPTSMASNHRSVQYMDSDGTWKNFPYREYGFNSLFNDTDAVNSGEVISQ
ncbi:MAG: pseudomurein-binding protein, partial [Bacilli bacterium]|nr:pseudomurein-binding protein [Bacilli bacterium]